MSSFIFSLYPESCPSEFVTEEFEVALGKFVSPPRTRGETIMRMIANVANKLMNCFNHAIL